MVGEPGRSASHLSRRGLFGTLVLGTAQVLHVTVPDQHRVVGGQAVPTVDVAAACQAHAVGSGPLVAAHLTGEAAPTKCRRLRLSLVGLQHVVDAGDGRQRQTVAGTQLLHAGAAAVGRRRRRLRPGGGGGVSRRRPRPLHEEGHVQLALQAEESDDVVFQKLCILEENDVAASLFPHGYQVSPDLEHLSARKVTRDAQRDKVRNDVTTVKRDCMTVRESDSTLHLLTETRLH